MKFMYEKQTRRFFIGVFLLVILLCISNVIQSDVQETEIKKMLVAHDTAVVSSLLKEGVSEQVIANAITNKDTSENASVLLGKLGISLDTDRRFLPDVQNLQNSMNMLSMLITCIFSLLLLAVTALFLEKRESLYKSATVRFISCLQR